MSRSIFLAGDCILLLHPLMAEYLRYQRAYYVYNPATRQHLSVPVTPTSCVTFAAVRFENLYDLVSSVTIESFSSETNMWSTIDITLDVPISIILHRWTKSASYGVIDGVFCWFNALSQFIFYDSVNTCLWALQLNPEMYAFDGQCLGVLGGDLYYASCNEADITLWQDAVWVRKYTANLTNALVNYCPGLFQAEVMCGYSSC
ncbi:hypothetical protein H5410_024795 [Solanum commersonii]|uniref:Uncharacterized protein n=1 Tax=Solanum commersonii TaxID=4109 RepID=A0A9J5ZN30_SOLCO|nr:hypothetical protein H5410_024795 [Solanum commersonii]